MPPVLTPETLQIVYAWEDEAVNVFHLTNGIVTWPLSVADTAVALDDFATAFGTNILPLLATQQKVDQITATDVSVANGSQVTITSSGAGGIAQEPLPAQVAAVISWRTQQSGRRRRGRTFLPGIPSGAQDPNDNRLFTSTFCDDMAAAAGDFILDLFTANDWLMGVRSIADDVTREVLTATVDNRIDTQMRRNNGR